MGTLDFIMSKLPLFYSFDLDYFFPVLECHESHRNNQYQSLGDGNNIGLNIYHVHKLFNHSQEQRSYQGTEHIYSPGNEHRRTKKTCSKHRQHVIFSLFVDCAHSRAFN